MLLKRLQLQPYFPTSCKKLLCFGGFHSSQKKNSSSSLKASKTRICQVKSLGEIQLKMKNLYLDNLQATNPRRKTNMTIKHPPFEDVFPIENEDLPVSFVSF